MTSLSSFSQPPSVHRKMATSATSRPFIAAHSSPLCCGGAWWICRNFRGLKLWMLQNLNFQGPRRKHEEKNEFRKLHIEDKDQSLDLSEPNNKRRDLQQSSVATVSTESSWSSNPQHGKSSLANQFDNSIRIVTSMESSHLQQTQALSVNFQSRPTFLSIAVIGATGELARRKIFPALFALYYSGFLPEGMTTETECQSLELEWKKWSLLPQGEIEANRIFYLSVPQEALLDVASSLADDAQSEKGWNRIIIEKPFGSDLQSSYQLTHSFLLRFKENQLYRIDHLLGRNTIENLAVLRFSNLIFMPLWNRNYIRNVQVILSEDLGLKKPDGYLNSYGIIGDVVHSHIFQTIALLAMEPPVTLDGEDVRNEKVKLLRSIRKLDTSDVILGYCKPTSGSQGATTLCKTTPTYFAAALYIDNARWDGVPFLIKVGRGLNKNRVEIRIRFCHVPGNLYLGHIGHNSNLANNELILRDVPDEAILVRVNNKIPGLGICLDTSELNLLYKDKYDKEVPDSYEQLVHDVIDGDNHLFMRSDEVAAAWNVLSPVLQEMDTNNIVPEQYEQGGRGPDKAVYLWAKHGVQWMDD